MKTNLFGALALVVGGLVPALSAGDAWPQYRGPTAQGVSTAKGLPMHWGEGSHVAWKTPIPGEGWSSPVVSTDAVWLTTALDEGHSLHAIKVDLASGKLLLDIEVFTNETVPVKHDRNSYASPSPVLDGDHVFVHFGSMGTACLACSDGHKIWENRTLKVNFEVGAGGSPTIYRDRLLIACDGTDAQYEVALDTKTGKQLWRADRSAVDRLKRISPSSRKCFGTPIVLTINGKDQSITSAAERLYAYDPMTGTEQWHLDFTGYSNAAVPVTDGKMLIMNTGFDHSEVWGITMGDLVGDITPTHVAWKMKLPGWSQASALLIDGRVYIVNDSGMLHCLNATTGALLYKERISSDFAASPIYVDGHIYCFDARGKATIFSPGATFTPVATNQLDEGCMASPAVVDSSLVIRGKKSLYRIE